MSAGTSLLVACNHRVFLLICDMRAQIMGVSVLLWLKDDLWKTMWFHVFLWDKDIAYQFILLCVSVNLTTSGHQPWIKSSKYVKWFETEPLVLHTY